MKFDLVELDDERDVALHIADRRDLDQVADYCKHLRDLDQKGDGKHVASVPDWIVQRYCDLRGITFRTFMLDQQEINRFLDDPVTKPFRTYEGNV